MPSCTKSRQVYWTPGTNGGNQNVYYALISAITGAPPGNGWSSISGNPLVPTAATALLSNLCDGQYRVSIVNDCGFDDYDFLLGGGGIQTSQWLITNNSHLKLNSVFFNGVNIALTPSLWTKISGTDFFVTTGESALWEGPNFDGDVVEIIGESNGAGNPLAASFKVIPENGLTECINATNLGSHTLNVSVFSGNGNIQLRSVLCP